VICEEITQTILLIITKLIITDVYKTKCWISYFLLYGLQLAWSLPQLIKLQQYLTVNKSYYHSIRRWAYIDR
jgi:hypothetical protein